MRHQRANKTRWWGKIKFFSWEKNFYFPDLLQIKNYFPDLRKIRWNFYPFELQWFRGEISWQLKLELKVRNPAQSGVWKKLRDIWKTGKSGITGETGLSENTWISGNTEIAGTTKATWN